MGVVSVIGVLQGYIVVDSGITMHGWVRTHRDSKTGISSLATYDGSRFGFVQAAISNSLSNYSEDILRPTTGCSVIMTDKVVASPGQRRQLKIQTSKVRVVGWIEDPDTYPMAAKRRNVEYLCKAVHLRPCTNLIGVAVHIRRTLAQALCRFFNEQGLFWISTPLITTSDTKGAGEMFYVSTLGLKNLPRSDQGGVDFDKDFSGKKSFLTVSDQLNGETCACVLPKVCTFGPTFRAENSNTNRHLMKFQMLEPEVAFANLNGIAGPAEAILKYVFKAVLEGYADDVKFFAKRVDRGVVSRLERLIEADFAQVDYTDTVIILEDYGGRSENPIYWGIDLSSERERYLAEECFKAPMVVKSCLRDTKTFYMRLNGDGKTVAAMDILALDIGEIVGGSQREEHLDALDERMPEMGLNKEGC